MSTNTSDADIENLLSIIANLPDFLKLSICRTKVKELVEMTESEKKETMIRSLASVNMINQDKLAKLTKTWMKVISEIEPNQLTKILHSYLVILDNVKLFDKLDPKLILNTFSSLEDGERDKLLVCIKEALFLNADRGQILKNIPTNLAKVILN